MSPSTAIKQCKQCLHAAGMNPEIGIEIVDASNLDARIDKGADASGDEPTRVPSDGGGKRTGHKQKHANKPATASNTNRKWLRIDAHSTESHVSGSAARMLAAKLGVQVRLDAATVLSLSSSYACIDHTSCTSQPRDLRFLELHSASYSPAALLARDHAIIVSFEDIRCIITLTYVLVVNPFEERVASLIEDFKAQLVSQQQATEDTKMMRFPGESKLTDVASKLKFGRTAVELPFELKALEICFDKVGGPRLLIFHLEAHRPL